MHISPNKKINESNGNNYLFSIFKLAPFQIDNTLFILIFGSKTAVERKVMFDKTMHLI